MGTYPTRNPAAAWKDMQSAAEPAALAVRHVDGITPFRDVIQWVSRPTRREAVVMTPSVSFGSGDEFIATTPFRLFSSKSYERRLWMLLILLIILILLLMGVQPRWRYSRRWGYYPTGGVGLLLLIVIILLLLGY